MKIVQFQNRYRDDLIFMILEAKNALGRIPGLNEDLLDIEKNYFKNGDMFWIALDGNDRVIGSVGYKSIPHTNNVFLHRLFVKYNLKHQGIGTELLNLAESHLKNQSKKQVYVNLGVGEEWFESRSFYKKYGYVEYKPNVMFKQL